MNSQFQLSPSPQFAASPQSDIPNFVYGGYISFTTFSIIFAYLVSNKNNINLAICIVFIILNCGFICFVPNSEMPDFLKAGGMFIICFIMILSIYYMFRTL